MSFATADLYDEYGDDLQVALPLFNNYGGLKKFSGAISTVKCHEDNSLVRAALEEAGEGRVLVVDGGESMRCALLGDMLAKLGFDNGWNGVIVSGCIRDSVEIATMEIGVKAMATNPRKSLKKGRGDRDIDVEFAGVRFITGSHVYADEDGIVVSGKKLI